MQTRSALARLQQAITLSLSTGALAWLAWHCAESPFLAVGGFLVIAMGYSLFLAAEFIALRFAGQATPALRPSWTDLLRAWFAETLAAPRVFCWRQPFRWNALPDVTDGAAVGPSRRGVVFIHGFFCNRGFWLPWLTRARAQGRCYAAVNLEPVFGSIDAYAPTIERAVREVTNATGVAPVLVCHSMGGLAARAWLRTTGSDAAHRVVTIGTPHQGTWLARFSHVANGRQMQRHGEWLEELQQFEASRTGSPFTCWYSNCDNIVFPVLTATLPGADNRLVRGAAHVDLAFRPEVMEETFSLIEGSDAV